MGRGVANHPGGDAAARLHQHGVAVRKAAGLALGTLAAYGPGVAAGPGDFAPHLERQSLAGKLDEVRQGAGVLRGGLPKRRGEGNHQSLFLLRVAGADLRQGLQVAQPARRRASDDRAGARRKEGLGERRLPARHDGCQLWRWTVNVAPWGKPGTRRDGSETKAGRAVGRRFGAPHGGGDRLCDRARRALEPPWQLLVRAGRRAVGVSSCTLGQPYRSATRLRLDAGALRSGADRPRRRRHLLHFRHVRHGRWHAAARPAAAVHGRSPGDAPVREHPAGGQQLACRHHVAWSIVLRFLVGSTAMFLVMRTIAILPSKAAIYIGLGLIPFAAYALPRQLTPDITRPGAPYVCGAFIILLQLLAGAAGHILDIFYQKSPLDRRTIVGTKVVTQVTGHVYRIAYFGSFAVGFDGQIPIWGYAVAIALAVAGTSLAGLVLVRMTESGFRQWSRRITIGVALSYLARGLWLIAAP